MSSEPLSGSIRLPHATPSPVAFGKYQLVERLGRGGMAEVWKAKMVGPAGFTRTLVVKRVLPHLVEDPHFIEMFVAEARLSARLNHANIVQVFDFGDVDGEYYLAMEYVRGRDLVNVMRSQLMRGRPDPGLGAYAVREVCRALYYAHTLTDDNGQPLRLIHRDVSPSNVMLSFDGAVKLLDFGIAKALAEADNHTQTGTLKGKFGYMAPEQVEGRNFDHRADLFAAGIVLHETLAGRRLFKGGGDLQTIAMVRDARVEPPSVLNPMVSPELDRITLKALAKNPDERYQTCEQMAYDLDQVVHQLKWGPERLKLQMTDLFAGEEPSHSVSLPPLALDAPPAESVNLRPSSRPLRVAVVAAAGVVLLGSAAFLLGRGKPKPATPAVVVPAAVPAAPQEPPMPQRVRVRVLSNPPGAEVVLEGTADAREGRGRTPFSMLVPRGTRPRRVQVRLSGYKPAEDEVMPDSDVSVQLTLQPDAPAPRPPVVVLESPPPKHKDSKKASQSKQPQATPPSQPKPPPKNLKAGDLADPFK